jgi:integrase
MTLGSNQALPNCFPGSVLPNIPEVRNMRKITQSIVESYDGSEGEILWDSGKGGVTGLGLRYRGNSRKWVFQYRLAGKSHRATIGDAAAWKLEAARTKARAMRVNVDSGIDPSAEKESRVEAAKLTLKSVIDDYLEASKAKLRSSSLAATTHHLQTLWGPLHNLPIANITRATIAGRLREIVKDRGPVAADRARSSLSALFAWAIGEGIGEGILESNPVTGTNKASKDEPRERTLSDEEIVAIWNAAPHNHYGAIIKLLILTGQRRDEIGSMRWSELELKKRTLTLPGERTKNHRTHSVPLSNAAIEILDGIEQRVGRDLVFGFGEGGFSGWSYSKKQIDETINVPPWTIHDVRRTVRTGLGRLAVAPHVAEAVLNHLPGKLIRTYDAYKYENEKRQALDLWAEHVAALLAGEDKSNVHKLRA